MAIIGKPTRPGWAGLQRAELRVRQQLARARLAQQGAATLEALAVDGAGIYPDDPSGSSDEHPIPSGNLT